MVFKFHVSALGSITFMVMLLGSMLHIIHAVSKRTDLMRVANWARIKIQVSCILTGVKYEAYQLRYLMEMEHGLLSRLSLEAFRKKYS